MSSRVIKFAAGAGKTTWSIEYLKNHPGGLYLAFTNSVVNSLKIKGYISKTIDSLFGSYIIPKFFSLIPIIANGSQIKINENSEENSSNVQLRNIRIDESGWIWNKNKKSSLNIQISNESLHSMSYVPNLTFVKRMFGKGEIFLTYAQIGDLAEYLINNYGDLVVASISDRFSYVIFDEAQDLKSFREKFAALLCSNGVDVIALGDDNQNIAGGGSWFRNLRPDETNLISHRCPEANCEWIRDNVGFQIFGVNTSGGIVQITNSEAHKYDDGIRTLLYSQSSGLLKPIIDGWKGPKDTIKSAKGSTIENDIVIIGKTMDKKSVYTALTRTKQKAYIAIEKFN